MRVVRNGLWLCQECMLSAVNGDSAPPATEAGLRRLWLNLVTDSPSDGSGELEFSSLPCDCCRSRLAGGRYRFAVLG